MIHPGVVADNQSMLVRAGLVSQTQLHDAFREQRMHGGTVAEHLVAAGSVDEERLCSFYRERLLVPRVQLKELSRIPTRVIARVPADMAVEFRVIPLDFDREGNLLLAMSDPTDTHAVDEIAFFTGTFVVRAIAGPSAIAWALNHYHGVRTRLAKPRITSPLVAPHEEEQAPPPTLPPPPAPAKTLPDPVAIPEPRPSTPVPVEVQEEGSGVVVISRATPPAVPSGIPTPVDVTEEGSGVVITSRPTPAAEPEPERKPSPADTDITDKRPKLPAVIVEGDDDLPPLEAGPEPVPPLSPEADEALETAIAQLHGATSSDSVAAIAVGFLAKLCRRAAFFVVRKGQLAGWTGTGVGIKELKVKKAVLQLDQPSTFQDVVRTRLPYRGPVADPPSRDFLIAALGWAPEDMLAIPVAVREKVVGVLYGDERIHVLPDEHLGLVARQSAEAFERALAAMKLSQKS